MTWHLHYIVYAKSRCHHLGQCAVDRCARQMWSAGAPSRLIYKNSRVGRVCRELKWSVREPRGWAAEAKGLGVKTDSKGQSSPGVLKLSPQRLLVFVCVCVCAWSSFPHTNRSSVYFSKSHIKVRSGVWGRTAAFAVISMTRSNLWPTVQLHGG